MDRKTLEERVDEILLKRTRGEKLTDKEHSILAYTYYTSDRHSKVFRIREDR